MAVRLSGAPEVRGDALGSLGGGGRVIGGLWELRGWVEVGGRGLGGLEGALRAAVRLWGGLRAAVRPSGAPGMRGCALTSLGGGWRVIGGLWGWL